MLETYLQKKSKQLMSNTQKILKPENLYFEKVYTEMQERYLQKDCKQLMSLTKIFTIKITGKIISYI